jgi:phosphatidate cytidylyltransferase
MTGLALGIALTVTLLFLPTGLASGVLALLWLAGAWEWAGLARCGATGRSGYVGVFLLLMLAATASRLPVRIDLLLAVALAAWGVAFFGVLTFPRRIPLAWVLVAGPVALLPAWLILKFMHASQPRGPELTLLALALVWAADVGAFVAGRLFGRVKLAPNVSPGKTWEGVGGGVVLALAVAYLGASWIGLAPWPVVAVATCTALVSVVGDLAVSMLKRNVGLKDSGHLLPGHGGVMDRIDGLIAAVPMYAVGMRIAGVLG